MSSLENIIKNLPDTPGIYLYYNKSGELIYVGKATSLKSRVGSYFRGKRTPRPIEEMIHEVAKIDYKVTDSVLEAVILEAVNIKKYLPKYNVLGKDDKSWNYIVITSDPFPKVTTIRQREYQLLVQQLNKQGKQIRQSKHGMVFGPYPGLNAAATLKVLRKLFHFSNCEPNTGRPCLYKEMGLCLGVCTSEITAKEYKARVITPLKWFLSGKKKPVIKEFEKRMKAAAAAQEFEEAVQLRNQLRGLQRIHDITLINKSFFELDGAEAVGLAVSRIEGYDISNLGATDKVGSMVVFDGSGPVKSEYRKFNIKTVVGQSDVDCLAEVLERRLRRADWPMPDVILLDGGWPQVNRIKNVFKQRGVTIPFLGIAKGAERKRNDIILGMKEPVFVDWAYKHQSLLIRVRDEAHRFAITFNRSKRKIVRRK